MLKKLLSFSNFPRLVPNRCIMRSTTAFNSKTFADDGQEDEERVYKQVNLETFQNIYKNDNKVKEKIQHILGVYEHGKYTTMDMPMDLSHKDMNLLLAVCHDEKELHRSLKFFYTRECKKYSDKKRKLRTQAERMQLKKDMGLDGDWLQGIWDANHNLCYGLWKNAITGRIPKQALRNYRQKQLLRQAGLFGQKLLIDLDYDEYMKLYECQLLGVQVGLLYYENRVNRDFREALPFDIHFVNCHKGKNTLASIAKHIQRCDQLAPYFHECSYLDKPHLFPKQRLVYLSPHSSQPLRQYDHDDIFILGAYNDRTTHAQVSHIKAASEGIRCYRLPLDENVLWKQGNKNLCLNQVAAILQAVKATDDWRFAVQHFSPQRKIKSSEEIALEDEIRIKRVARRMRNIAKSHT